MTEGRLRITLRLACLVVDDGNGSELEIQTETLPGPAKPCLLSFASERIPTRSLLTAVSLFCLLVGAAFTHAPQLPGWKLVWSDEFN